MNNLRRRIDSLSLVASVLAFNLLTFAPLGVAQLSDVQTADVQVADVQVSEPDSVEDQEAAIIKAVTQRLVLSPEVSGDFVQEKIIAVLPKPLRSTGDFSYRRSVGLIWTTREPVESELTFNTDGISQRISGEAVWQIDSEQPLASALTQVMTGVFSANWDALKDYFVISGQINEQSWTLSMIPKDATWKKILNELIVSGNTQLESLVMLEPGGDKTLITLDIETPVQH